MVKTIRNTITLFVLLIVTIIQTNAINLVSITSHNTSSTEHSYISLATHASQDFSFIAEMADEDELEEDYCTEECLVNGFSQPIALIFRAENLPTPPCSIRAKRYLDFCSLQLYA